MFALPANASTPRDPDVPVATILAAYDNATRSDDVKTFVADGTLAGEGLQGSFHVERDQTDEREDDVLGPRHETTLRLGDRLFVRNANGNVRELRGYLHRRALTEELLDSGDFVKHPELARFVGWSTFNGKRVWRLEVDAVGGEPETLWIDPDSGLPVRLEYLDGDGPSYVDYGDWRMVGASRIPFRAVMTDGDHRFDTVQQTTSVQIDQPVDRSAFVPLVPRLLESDGVHTVPLIRSSDGHYGVTVRIANRDWFFLLDTGAQSILVDTAVLKAAGVTGEGAMEVRGAARSGGLRTATLPSISIDGATMSDVIVSSLDIGANLGGMKIDGILGYPFFASAIVEMDFAHGQLRFGAPGSFVPTGARVDLDVDRELAEANFVVNGRLDAPFIVDTGNSEDMLLYRPFLDKHPGVVPTTGAGSWNYGIGGSNAIYRTSLDELQMASYQLYHRPVDVVLAQTGAFADRVDAGNVGLGVLRNFVATFDLANASMYLTPGASFDSGVAGPSGATSR
ncbi:MAG TPA: aspartyl protease family protein [Candidatus Sulfotelmatobacter sp.]|nr:aspartyl protease family protein [Candidatus Sulfotelmatobacter sp.]